MRKLLTLAIASVSFAISAHAQIGVVAGITSSSTDVKSAMETVQNVNKYHVGLVYRMSLGGVIALQPGLVYNVKGSTIGGFDPSNVTNQIDFKTGFLELPVQLQAGLPLFGLARVYGLAEPYIGYAITNSWKESMSEVQKGWDNVKNRFEYGLGLGAGVEVLNTVQVAVKYFWDLGELYGSGSSDLKLNDKLNQAINSVQSGKCSGIALSAYIIF